MYNPTTRQNRATVVVVALTVLLVGAVLLFFTLSMGWYFYAMAGIVGLFALLGALHYLTWGHAGGEPLGAPPPYQNDMIANRPTPPATGDGRGNLPPPAGRS